MKIKFRTTILQRVLVLTLLFAISYDIVLAQGLTISNGTITIGAGAELKVIGGVTITDTSFIENRGNIGTSGDWINNGNGLLNDSTGIVEFNGTAQQVINGTKSTNFSAITINNPNDVLLKRDTRVARTITFMTGKILTDSSELHYYSTQPGFAPTIGADKSKYIATSSTGHSILTFHDSNSNILMPIGDAYAPITLSLNGVAGGDVDIMSYTTTGIAPHENTPKANASGIDQNKKCDHYWVMTKSGTGNFTTCTANFDLTNTKNSGDISKYIVKRYDKANGWMTVNSSITGTLITLPEISSFGEFVIGESTATSVDLPVATLLEPNRVQITSTTPNPVSSSITLTYSHGSSENVRIELFTILGESIALLSNQYQTQGEHSSSFDVSTIPEGMYFIHLTTLYSKATAVLNVVH